MDIAAIQIKNTTIMCDEPGCNWKQKTTHGKLRSWYNKPCPQCHTGIIINDDDIAALDKLDAIIEATKHLKVSDKEIFIKGRFDTSSLRN